MSVGGARIAALISLVVSAGLIVTGAYKFREAYNDREDLSPVTSVVKVYDSISTSLGGGKIDLDKELRIILYCCGTAVVFGILQFVTSLMVLFCSTKSSTWAGKFWLFINSLTELVIIAYCICLFWNGNEPRTRNINWRTDEWMQAFLGTSIGDFVILIFITGIITSFVRGN